MQDLIMFISVRQRTYGPWWNQSSSAAPKIGRTPESFISQDYVGKK